MKLADVSIQRPVLASVMVGVLIVFGIAAYPRIEGLLRQNRDELSDWDGSLSQLLAING